MKRLLLALAATVSLAVTTIPVMAHQHHVSTQAFDGRRLLKQIFCFFAECEPSVP